MPSRGPERGISPTNRDDGPCSRREPPATVDPVATQTLLKGETTARRTTVFMKVLMASTGALFVFYVLMHMYGNLKIFAGAKAFDEYAEHLREMLVPILPYSGFLWLFRVLPVSYKHLTLPTSDLV